jgi:hypothetical protein
MQEQEKDDRLWRTARRRAAFRKNLFSYIVVNTFLWGVWWFTSERNSEAKHDSYPWPIWVMLGWGLGLAMQFFKAYNGDRQDLAEQEYERLKKQQIQ